jgi:hypothetical protein
VGIGNHIPRGQKTIREENVSEQIITDGTGQSAVGFTIKATSTNAGTVFIGDERTRNETGFELNPGDSISLDVLNGSQVWISGNREDRVSWIGVTP